MFCGKCGAQIEDNARFCPKCGEVQKPSGRFKSNSVVNRSAGKKKGKKWIIPIAIV